MNDSEIINDRRSITTSTAKEFMAEQSSYENGEGAMAVSSALYGIKRMFGFRASERCEDVDGDKLTKLTTNFIDAKIGKKKERSQRSYRTALRQFVEYVGEYLAKEVYDLEFADLTQALIEDFKADWLENYAVATAAQRLNVVKSFTKHTAKVLNVEDPCAYVTIIKPDEPDFIGLSTEQYEAVAAVLPTIENAQKRFCVELLLGTGLRNDEVCNLRIGQVAPEYDYLLGVKCKGAKKRDIGIGVQTRAALERFMMWRKAYPMGRDEFLFISRAKRLNNKTVLQWTKDVCARAGIPPSLSHPHTMRHTFAYRTLRVLQALSPGDPMRALIQVMQLMGHSNIKTTLRYLGNERRKLWEAIQETH